MIQNLYHNKEFVSSNLLIDEDHDNLVGNVESFNTVKMTNKADRFQHIAPW